MRKLMRSIARAKMQKAGIQKPNRKRRDSSGNVLPSFFAEHWREYVSA